MSETRRASTAGKAVLTLDFRSKTDSAYWNSLGAVLALASVLQELVGPDALCLLEFGRLIISEIDLAAVRARMTD